MDTLWQDLRYAVRMLTKSPGFTAVAVLTLALGIGANTSIFGLVNAVLLRPIPVDHPEQMVALFTGEFDGQGYDANSYDDYLDLREKASAFSGMVAYTLQPMDLDPGEMPRRIWGEIVSENYFQVLGLPAALGRNSFDDTNRSSGALSGVIISHRLWETDFGSNPAVIGQTVRLTGHPFTVLGVAPRNFAGLSRFQRMDLWVSVEAYSQVARGHALHNRNERRFSVLGRLKPGASMAQARAQLAVLAGQLYRDYPRQWANAAGQGCRIVVLSEEQARLEMRDMGADKSAQILTFSALAMTGVQFVLFASCANLAGLLLARTVSRRKEIAIRLSLGASRARVMRQFLTETVLLGLAGGAAALLVSLWVTDLLASIKIPGEFPVAFDFPTDGRVFAFNFAVSVLAGVAVGFASSWQATRAPVNTTLKEAVFGGGTGKNHLRRVFVIAQVALSVPVLIGAGLFLRSLHSARVMDPGFDLREGLLITTDVNLHGYDAERSLVFYEQLLEKAKTLPGVESATLGSMPLGFTVARRDTLVEGYALEPGKIFEFPYAEVAPGYLRTLGIPLVKGRDFTAQDRLGAPQVGLVNEAFVKRFWPIEDPIGKRVGVGGWNGTFLEIVGVVKDGKYVTLGEEPTPWLARPFAQARPGGTTLILRSQGNPVSVREAALAAIRSLDKSVPVNISTVDQHLSYSLLQLRTTATLLEAFAGLALALMAVGLGGAMAFWVNQRTQEIGVRMALGATRNDVLGMVLGQGVILTAIGGALGLLIALGATRLLASQLYGVSPTDALSFVSAAVLLAAVALLACWIPARRATRVDPMVALRYE